MSRPGTDGWMRPHRRSSLASTVVVGGAVVVALVPTLVGIARSDAPGAVAWIIAVAAALFIAGTYIVEIVRVRRTALCIDGEWVRYRFEFLQRKHVNVPRGRVRTVEVTADPVQRYLGIVTLKIGSGEKDGQIVMRSLAKPVAEQLRATLLAREASGARDGRDRVGELARWQAGWLRYAPPSLASAILAGAAFGVPLQIAEWFNAAPQVWHEMTRPVRGTGLLLGILIIAAIALVVGVVAAVALQAEAWWNYRLERQADGTLHVERGLLVRRSTVFEGRRIRGVVIVERLGARWLNGARLELIALGLGKREGDENKSESSTVLPEAPREVAIGVLSAITGEGLPSELSAHPPAARAKRVRWAFAASAAVAVAALAVVLTTGVGWWLLALAVVVSLPATIWLAFASYAALGHALTATQLYIRYGPVRRATHVLRREAIVSWNVRQSVFQRRQALASIGATTSADLAVIIAPDVGVGQARDALLASDSVVWSRLTPGDR